MKTLKKLFVFQETKTPKKIPYISEGNFPCSKKWKTHSEKASYILGNGKISSPLGLLLILFAERELFKHKHEIN